MPESWVLEETRATDLKDARLNVRLREVLEQLGGRPAAGIPEACGGHAEMTAAYRLFGNKKATFEGILQSHVAASRVRMAAQKTVLLVQDTTELDVTRPSQQVAGAGPLDRGARRGMLLHLLHAFTPDGTPLGTVSATPWARDEPAEGPRPSRAERAAIPIERKESYRWIETFRQAQAEAPHCPDTQLICLCDSEADIYELLVEAEAEPTNVPWVVRASQDRALRTDEAEPTARYLSERLQRRPVLFTQTIHVRPREGKVACETRKRRKSRPARDAHVEVRSGRVALRPPYRPDRKLPVVEVNVVLVREVDPPKGEEPIEWLLLTSLPVDNAEMAQQVIQSYYIRWMIEVFFRVLKSGCRVEARRFECLDRLQTCLAVYLIVAWRTLYVCRLGRGCPDLNCEAVFEPAEWKSVWKVVQRRNPPRRPPTLGEMMVLVAQLGGYIPHKSNGPPGPQTVWIGLQRAHDFALCWKAFGPEKRNDLKDV